MARTAIGMDEGEVFSFSRIRNLAGVEDAVLFGNTTPIGSFENATSNGTATIAAAAHGLSVAAGDLLHITDATTAADKGFYEIQSSTPGTIVVDRALAGSDADVDFIVYKDVIAAFDTDGTNGQIITAFSHQDKPLQLGGITHVATTAGLTARDVLVAGQLEVKSASVFWSSPSFQTTVYLSDGAPISFGHTGPAWMLYAVAQTPDSVMLAVGVKSRALIFCEYGDEATDFLNPLQTDPTLIFQSSDATKIYEGGYYNWNSITGKAIGAVAVNGSDFTITAQAGGTSGDRDGGRLILWGGAKGNAGADGYVSVGTPASGRGCDKDSLYVAGVFEVDGMAYMDSGLETTTIQQSPNAGFYSDYTNAGVIYMSLASQTNDCVGLTLGATNTLLICEFVDRDIDFLHAQQTNPTLFIHSADATDVTQWISLAHNQTDAVISSGKGDIYLNPTGLVKFGTYAAIVAETLQGYVTINDASGNPRKVAVVA